MYWCHSPAKENTSSLPRKLMSESVIMLLLDPLPVLLPLLVRSASSVPGNVTHTYKLGPAAVDIHFGMSCTNLLCTPLETSSC